MNILSKFSRYLGVILIIFLCSFGHYSSLFENLHTNNTWMDNLIHTMTFPEKVYYDYKVQNTLDDKYVDKHIVRGDINDDSLQRVGRWPWSRAVWEKLIDRFNHFGAKVVALDAMFPEEEKACGGASPDKGFARAIKDFQKIEGRKVILSYEGSPNYYSNEDKEYKEFFKEHYSELPELLYNYMISQSQENEEIGFPTQYISKGTYPIETLLEAEPGVAYIINEQDTDGVFRRYKLAQNFHDFYVPSLGLMSYLTYTGKEIKLEIDGVGAGVLKVEGHDINLNTKGQALVRFKGAHSAFKTLDLADLYFAKDNDPVISEMVKDKLIIVGSSATGATDLRNTPIDHLLPGVFFHINVASQLINNYFYKDSVSSLKISVGIFILALLIVLLAEFFNNALIDIGLTVTVIALTLYLDTTQLFPNGYNLSIFYTIAAVIGIYTWNTFINFYISSKEKKQIKGAFSRYLAPTIVDDMLEHPEKLRVGGEKREITCFFSDVRDFTSISEKLSANDLAMVINRYMGEMTDILFEYKGTLDKYIGDAIVGFWNAPLDIEGHPQLAVEASIKMVEALPAINDEFKEQGFPEFKVGIGLNTGDCNVGNMGSDAIFAYTALGDAMNLGARLEGLCKFYGSMITISEYTFARLDHEKIKCRKLDKVRVKGKLEPVEIYEVLHSTHDFMTDTQSYDDFQKAYGYFHERKFSEAVAIFSALSEKYPDDKASARFKGMCEEFIANPPADDWDGVYTFKEK